MLGWLSDRLQGWEGERGGPGGQRAQLQHEKLFARQLGVRVCGCKDVPALHMQQATPDLQLGPHLSSGSMPKSMRWSGPTLVGTICRQACGGGASNVPMWRRMKQHPHQPPAACHKPDNRNFWRHVPKRLASLTLTATVVPLHFPAGSRGCTGGCQCRSARSVQGRGIEPGAHT